MARCRQTTVYSPGAVREGWLMFKKKPDPLTTLYVSSGVGVGVWDIAE